MVNNNYLLGKLKQNKPCIGTWSIIPSLVTIDIIASTGIDFIIIDREHGPFSFETAQGLAIACESRGVSPIFRVGDIDKASIQNALDIGMHGIQVPNIETNSDAKKVVLHSKYPPIGDRGFSPFTRSGGYSIKNASSIIKNANDNNLVILNIEGEEAISSFDSILEIDNIDVYFVGLFDLSKALGIPGDVENPRVIEKLEEITAKAKALNKHVGTIATNKSSLDKFVKMGLTYLVYLVDCEIIRNSYQDIITHFNSLKNV